jgi:hypothetical protein
MGNEWIDHSEKWEEPDNGCDIMETSLQAVYSSSAFFRLLITEPPPKDY